MAPRAGGSTAVLIPDARHPTGVAASALAALMLATFTVSVSYGIVLPLLPSLIEGLLGAASTAARISRHTGLLTGVYTLGLFLFAPLWGRSSDRYGRRRILLVGLVGLGATLLISSIANNVVSIYAERFLSGAFAAAVTPVASAAIGDLAATPRERAHRLTLVSLAGISGFLLGPQLGVLVARIAANVVAIGDPSRPLAIPLAATALLAFLIAAAVAATVPGIKRGDAFSAVGPLAPIRSHWIIPTLLALSFVVSVGVGVFEVGLALRGKLELGLTQYQVAMMFTECSLVMFVVQAAVFSPWTKPDTTRWLIAPALAVMGTGLLLASRASDFRLMVTAVAAVAASAGILSPILTYWISSTADHAQGAEFGKQTAASSLGAAVGSAAGGFLFGVGPLSDASLVLIAVLTGFGILPSIRLPWRLVRSDPVRPREVRPR